METQDKTTIALITRVYSVSVQYADGGTATHHIEAANVEQAKNKIWVRHVSTGKVINIEAEEEPVF